MILWILWRDMLHSLIPGSIIILNPQRFTGSKEKMPVWQSGFRRLQCAYRSKNSIRSSSDLQDPREENKNDTLTE